MAETLYADGTVSGSASTPANAHGAQDGTFTTDTGNTNWTHRWSLGNLTGTLDGTASVQIVVRARKDSSGGGNPTLASITLYDGGTSVGSNATGWSITSATGQDITVNITPSPSITSNGDNLAVELATTGTGGPPADRRSVQIDSITVTVQNASTNRKARLAWAELEVRDAPRKARVSWAEMEAPEPRTFPLVQSTTASVYNETGSPGTLTITFPQTATLGNLLVVSVFHRPGTTPPIPSGWSEAVKLQDATNADWLQILYKESDGTETSVTVGSTGSAGDSTTAYFGEYSGFSGTPTLDQTASNGPVDASSVASGTTATLASATSLAIAAFSGRTFGNTTATFNSYTNSFTEEGTVNAGATATHYSRHSAAHLETSSTAAVSTTATASNSGRLMGAIATFYDFAPSTDRAARLAWTELEVPTAPRRTQVSWAELELPDAARTARVAWAEVETPDGARAARVSWAEMETADAPRRAQLTWAEMEVGDPPRRVRVSWAEVETADAPRRARVAWSEMEIPTAPRRVQMSWAEIEIGDAPRAARVAWAEVEAPEITRSVRVTWSELEVPDAPRAARVAWTEIQTPDAARRVRVAWSEMELPDGARAAQVAWTELELPDGARGVQIAWAELEVPNAPRAAQLAWAELEAPDNPDRSVIVTWVDFQIPSPSGPTETQTRLLLIKVG